MIKHQVQQNEISEGNYFIIETGKSDNTRKQILHDLLQQRPGLKEVHSVSKCDVILVFCTICSRTGTDIDAALNKLKCSETEFKPAIFMVLHHTLEPEKIIEDSSRYVTRMNTLTVDFLFHEDSGLLKCKRNDEALTKIVQPFKKQCNLHPIISCILAPVFWLWHMKQCNLHPIISCILAPVFWLWHMKQCNLHPIISCILAPVFWLWHMIRRGMHGTQTHEEKDHLFLK